MNEQDKRELMLRAAVKFKGVWPDGYKALVVSTETNDCCGAGTYQDFTGSEVRFNSVMDDADTWLWVCTKQEFEAFIDSLFEGAPDDVTHHGGTAEYPHWYKKVACEWLFMDKPHGDWYQSASMSSGHQKEGNLIPRPRKQIKDLGDVTDIHVGEWSGNGLPPVGTKCEIQTDDLSDFYQVTIQAYSNDGKVVLIYDDFDDNCEYDYWFIDDTTFRPLKTEAEKEREENLTKLARGIMQFAMSRAESGHIFDNGPDVLAEHIHDELGWRPNE